MIPAYNKMRCAAFPFETGIHFRRKTDFFPEEDTTKSYSGFEPTRLQAKGHSHHTGWTTKKTVSKIVRVQYFVRGGFVGHRSRASSKASPFSSSGQRGWIPRGSKRGCVAPADARVGVGSTKKAD
ncbi:hypothetical protein TNCV_4030001 [Trichonephila clavipes]|nr:hypothetical protein TNCV_4030001 [Trichonephila clavipes]